MYSHHFTKLVVILCILGVVGLSLPTNAQVTCQGDVIIANQSDLNNFNCSVVRGNLVIENTNFKNLSPLSSLTEVQGTIFLRSNFSLTSLDGLDNLSKIGGAFFLGLNVRLVDITALSNLKSIGGNFILESQDLPNIEGLEGLTEVGGDLRVIGTSVSNLNPFRNLQSVGGTLEIRANNRLPKIGGLADLSRLNGLQIENNFNLTSINGLRNLEVLEGKEGSGLFIRGNKLLNDLSPLSKLREVGTQIRIFNNTALTSLEALDGITNFQGSIFVSENRNLSTCCALQDIISQASSVEIFDNASGCSSVTEINTTCTSVGICEGDVILNGPDATFGDFDCRVIKGNLIIVKTNLKDLSALSSLEEIQGNFTLRDNAKLTSLKGLENLKKIGGIVSVRSTPNLSNIRALSNLQSIGRGIEIFGPSLTSLQGLEGLKTIGDAGFELAETQITNTDPFRNIETITGALVIRDNERLQKISGLARITRLGGLKIRSNSKLNSINGLRNLEVLENLGLLIVSNPLLSDISPLSKLKTINVIFPQFEGIEIRKNDGLSSIDALEGVTTFQGSILVNFNPNLSACCALTDLFDAAFATGIVDINNNAEDCERFSKIVEVCEGISNPPPSTSPSVNITKPFDSQVYTKGQNIEVEAQVQNLGNNSVEFFVGFPNATFSIRKVKNGDGTYNFEFNSGTVNVVPKVLKMIVRIISDRGLVLTEDIVSVLVVPEGSNPSPPSGNPTVNITKPLDNQTYTKGEIIQINAEVQNLGTNSVEFLVGFPRASFSIRKVQNGDGTYDFEFDSGTVNVVPKDLDMIVQIVGAQGNILAEDMVPILVNPANSLATNTLSPGLVMAFYPNKVKEGTQIRLKLFKPTQEAAFVIRDAMGQEVQSGAFNLNQPEDELQINLLKNIPAGLYILEIRDQAGFSQIRFIKE